MTEKELNNLKAKGLVTDKTIRNSIIKEAVGDRIRNGMSQRQAMLESEVLEGYPLSYSAIWKIIQK